MDKEQIVKAFFQTNHKYYFDRFNKNSKVVTFNIWPALFGLFWFVYRKMYKQAFVIFISMILLEIVVGFVILYGFNVSFDDYNKSYRLLNSGIVYLISFITLGLIGNKIYFYKAKIAINDFTSKHDLDNTDDSRLAIIRNKGGVDYKSVIVIIVIFILINIIMTFIK
jgi:Protein of unknown function (DUF2628)